MTERVSQPASAAVAADVVVIGFGSDLRGDDALGPIVGRRLEAMLADCPAVRVEICQGLTPDLALPLAEARLAVFIDCCAEGPAGSLLRREVAAGAGAAMSMVHFLDPEALLTWTRAMYGRAPRGVIFTVPGESFEIAEELSPSVAAVVPELIRGVMTAIQEVSHA